MDEGRAPPVGGGVAAQRLTVVAENSCDPLAIAVPSDGGAGGRYDSVGVLSAATAALRRSFSTRVVRPMPRRRAASFLLPPVW